MCFALEEFFCTNATSFHEDYGGKGCIRDSGQLLILKHPLVVAKRAKCSGKEIILWSDSQMCSLDPILSDSFSPSTFLTASKDGVGMAWDWGSRIMKGQTFSSPPTQALIVSCMESYTGSNKHP